jgi:hypothetical protein
MNREPRTVRLHIDGLWSAEEMGQFLLDLRDLYNLVFALLLLRDDSRAISRDLYGPRGGPPPDRFRRWLWVEFGYLPPSFPNLKDAEALSQLVEPDERLQVRRIQYGSAGIKDLTGLGEVIGHLKDFLLRLIELKVTSTQRKHENRKRELENQRLQIENAKALVAVGKELGLSEYEMRELAGFVGHKQDRMAELVRDRKLTGLEERASDDEQGPDEPEEEQ